MFMDRHKAQKNIAAEEESTAELLFSLPYSGLQTFNFSWNIFTQKQEIRKEAHNYSLITMWFYLEKPLISMKKSEFVAETRHNTLNVFI